MDDFERTDAGNLTDEGIRQYLVAKFNHVTKIKDQRIKELEELLTEYGRHSPGCSAQFNVTNKKYQCRCGWDRERLKL